jgi:hypothetical protein
MSGEAAGALAAEAAIAAAGKFRQLRNCGLAPFVPAPHRLVQEPTMTEEEQNVIAATLTAHEHMIAFLLAKYVQRMSPDQREAIESAMKEPASVDFTALLNMDRGDAGRLAAVAVAHQDAINRVFEAAASLADGRD